MPIPNYMPFEEFSSRYPLINHSSRIYLSIVPEQYPAASEKQNYVDHSYFAEDYGSGYIEDFGALPNNLGDGSSVYIPDPVQSNGSYGTSTYNSGATYS